MICKLKNTDIDCLVDIWYRASVDSHHFIPADFWKNLRDDMRNVYIPNSETYTLIDHKEIIGFISLREEVLEAIFIDPEKQRKGYGGELMKYALLLREKLTLNVYSKNYSAIKFYQKYGFRIYKEGDCPHSGAMQLTMVWENR